jgi:hypothetical protein
MKARTERNVLLLLIVLIAALFLMVIGWTQNAHALGVRAQESTPFDVTPQTVLVLIGGFLALAFDYLPGLATWFDGLTVTNKRFVMLGLVVLAAVVLYIGTCQAWFQTTLTCEPRSLVNLLYGLVLAIAANFGFHKATKPTLAFKQRAGLVSQTRSAIETPVR